jgi:hypothetical protein
VKILFRELRVAMGKFLKGNPFSAVTYKGINAVFMGRGIRLTPLKKNVCTATPYEK